MTIILEVWGDGDYGAMFIEDEYGVKRAYEEAKAAGGLLEIKDPDDDKYTIAYVKIRKFGKVDPEFIHFIESEFIDYDMAKRQNFYVMEGDK